MVNVAGGVQPTAQLADLLVQDGHGDTGGRLDGRQHLALGQGVEPRLDELAQQRAERRQIGRVAQSPGDGLELAGGGRHRRRGHRRHNGLLGRIVGGRRAMAQVVVEVVAMQRPDDTMGDIGNVEPVGERGRCLPSRVPRIGEDGHPRDAVRPLPPSQPVGRQRGPGWDREDRLRRQRRLDALGNAQVAVLRQRRQTHRAAGHGVEHLLPRRRLGRAVLEQEGAMDAAGRHARAVAHDGDHAGPAAFGVVVGQVRVEQQVRRSRIHEPAAF